MRELAKASVLVGYCGDGGTPLFSANEVDFEVAWLSPRSEYRPTEYLQRWVRFWFDDTLRLAAAIGWLILTHRRPPVLPVHDAVSDQQTLLARKFSAFNPSQLPHLLEAIFTAV
ncbi:hypothetical protein NEE66_06275 [Thauera linaloolentis]|nr:hypothetical protein [Thauera linaloolentis]MCM8565197.1 hypothetical protein [Thauera linaloolentis]